RAVAIALACDREPDPNRRAVLAEVALLHLEGLDRAGAELIAQIVGEVRVAEMRNLLDRHSEQLLLGVAKHRAKLRVHVAEAPVLLDVRNADSRERHRRRESL